MAVKFNPFTGQLQIDEKGSGGGSSYIDGEVQNFSALPETLGTPAVDSAYLVREAEGTWLLNRKPAGIYIRTANTGTRASDWTYAGEFPDVFSDANFVLYDNGDSTRNLQFQLSGISTGTTRTITVPDANITLDDAGDSRTPSSHSSSHASAGSDPLFDQDLNTTDSVEFSELTTEVFFSTDQFDIGGEAGISFSNEDAKINTRTNLGLGDAATADIGTGSTEVAAGDHGHGNLTSDGKLGATAGLPVVTTTAGAVTTLALGTAGQVLTVNGTADGVEFAAASGGGVTGAAASASDVLGVSGSDITGVDAGSADRLVMWDDSASKLTYASVSGMAFDGTTLRAAQVDVYTANDTWNKPSGAKKVEILLIGGGGGGGNGRRGAEGTLRCGGGGGAGAGVVMMLVDADRLNTSETVTIGSGGGGAASVTADDTNGGAGTAGGSTTFSIFTAAGGGGGGGGTDAAAGAGGASSANRVTIFGSISAAGNAGSAGANASATFNGAGNTSSPAGGGGGGGRTTANSGSNGGSGGGVGNTNWGLTSGGARAAGGGENGAASQINYFGSGGGGGQWNGNSPGGNGGNYGAGGGGGGAAVNGAGGSNKGGDGASGIAVMTTYF